MVKTKTQKRNELATIAFLMDQHLRQRNEQLEQQLESIARELAQRNRLISQLHSDLDTICQHLVEAEDEIYRLRRTDRVLHSTDGRTALFRRNRDGVFVEVVDPPEEEPVRNVRRRLNFDVDSSDSDSDDELMTELLGF